MRKRLVAVMDSKSAGRTEGRRDKKVKDVKQHPTKFKDVGMRTRGRSTGLFSHRLEDGDVLRGADSFVIPDMSDEQETPAPPAVTFSD
eukprot:756667-Hanusia_phi.AAC.5